MPYAILRGKLRSSSSHLNDQLEDLLTSEIFSRIRYLDIDTGLLQILDKSQNAKNRNSGISIHDKSIRQVVYRFWPRLALKSGTTVEPDLIIEVKKFSGENISIIVECKHRSKKSESITLEDQPFDICPLTPRDQLVKELLVAKEIYPKTKIFLLYITGHTTMPEDEFDDSVSSIKEFEVINKEYFFENVFWIGWKDIWYVLSKQINLASQEKTKSLILEDLTKLLEYYGYRHYLGMPRPSKPLSLLLKPFFYKSGFNGWQKISNLKFPNKTIIYYKGR